MGRNGNAGHHLVESIKTAKKNLESYKLKMSGSRAFTCASCGYTWGRERLGGCHNYEAPPQLASRMVGPAAYAVCQKCEETLSSAQIQQNVTKTLAQQGLFK